MSFSQLDLTSVDASLEKNSSLVYRKPKIFNAKEVNGQVELIDDDGKSRLISKAVFQAKFAIWSNGQNKGFCLKPKKSHAIKISGYFSVSEYDLDGDVIKKIGHPGDYLITRESGENEICKKDDFDMFFISEKDIYLHMERDQKEISLTT